MSDRFDKASVISHKLDHNGYLNVNAYATRAGVFVYRQPDGTITRELRHPDEVFKADSLETLKKRPVVDNHPKAGIVNAKNTKFLAIGWNGDRTDRTEDDHVSIDVMITDEQAISKITDPDLPKVELSCGYKCDVIKEDGDFNGEPYDHVQKNIRYNHIALVNKGRAGHRARIYLDSDDGAVIDEYDPEVKHFDKEVTKMAIKLKRQAKQTQSFKVDAMNLEVPEDAESVVNTVLDHLDSAVVQIETLEKETAKLKADNDKLQGSLDELKTKHDAAMSPERIEAVAKERADLCGVAGHLGLTKFDGLTNAEIKKAIVQHKHKDLKLDEKSDDYITARYDGIVDDIRAEHKSLESLANLKKTTQPGRTKEDAADLDKKDSKTLSPREQSIINMNKIYSGDGQAA